MEMVIPNTPAPPPPTTATRSTPFRDHDVREWSRIDTITGALERARFETDSWTANTNDACHKYGKVVDSRARTGADGTIQQQASRQLEVFQSKAAGSQLQVVKTKTVSSSRWSGKLETNNKNLLINEATRGVFEDLQLPLNPLDITSQKSKASVGRSVSRRPPSRQIRSQTLTTSLFSKDLNNSNNTTTPLPSALSSLKNSHLAAATNLHRVSRLCHQIHESAVRNAFGRKSPAAQSSTAAATAVKRGSGDGSVGSGVKITEIESSTTATTASSSELNELRSHSFLTRTKSTSSDDIYHNLEKESGVKSIEDLEDLEELQNWRRSSKVRRSLQHPKPSVINSSTNSAANNSGVSVKKIREELEKGRRLNTALRNNSVSTNLEALDQIIQSISSTSSVDDQQEDLDFENEQLISKQKTKKRDSFVTVESLQEVRGRLRRTSSPSGSEMYKMKDEESDDGIVTEETAKLDKTANQNNRVKSYVYGMERMIQNKKPVMGTGSLESRSKLTNGTNSHKNEDWYNRRKSYGFEQVHNHEEPNSISLKDKKLVDSSTDSGICRSNDILLVPSVKSNPIQTNGHRNSDSESDMEKKKNVLNNNGINGIHCGNVKKMTSIFSQDERNPFYNNRQSIDGSELTGKIWNNKRSSSSAIIKENNWKLNEIKSTTITIPIVKNNNVIDLSWNEEPENETKRHSIAVDEIKYATNVNSTTSPETRLRRTSLVNEMKNENFDDDLFNGNRKPKKVEFCKTEVHFTAESGKVNIVETDEKPPPTQNFRRRRRISGSLNFTNEEFHKNGLPVLHFGDSSYEKAMFHHIGSDEETDEKHNAAEAIKSCCDPEIGETDEDPEPTKESRFSSFSVTVNNHNNTSNNNSNNNNSNSNSTGNNNNDNLLDVLEEDRKDLTDNENIKGILKNKPIKPKPYHLGETIGLVESNSEDDSRRWGGIRLRHVVPKSIEETSPIWKSTVTVHNSFYNDNEDETIDLDHKEITKSNNNNNQPEFQKLLRNLRPTTTPTTMKKLDYLSDNENCFANIRVLPMVKDNRRSSWSVSDKVKLIDESNQENTKGYSTKINFGDGEAIVVENDQSTWPRVENLLKDSKQILNRGLVVRIGRQDSSSTSKYSSKMTTTQENNKTTTTTTKITIDLSPSPQTVTDQQLNDEHPLTYTKFKRSDTLHKFKSTPLVLNTIKDRKEIVNNNKIPQQLEALKKLYEVASHSDDSDADKEVQQLMSGFAKNTDSMESDNSSVISGSWSKMKAFRNFGENIKRGSFRSVKSRIDLRNGDNQEKIKGSSERLTSYVSAVDSNNHSPSYTQYSVPLNKSKFSPVVLRKTISSSNPLRDTGKSDKLSSPHLVDKNLESSIKQPKQQDNSLEKRYRNIPDNKIKSKYISENIVLRQPKQSEMTYFGVNMSPQISKEVIQTAVIKKEQKISEKPDLLQHHHNKSSCRSPVPLIKPRKDSPLEIISSTNPIYENIKPKLPPHSKYSNHKDFDSTILDELTKAADQILLAVNGYADEDYHISRLSSDEERILRKPLDTISETKSWKNTAQDVDIKNVNQTCMRPTLASAAKVRVKRTSSTSSVESLSKDRKKNTSSSVERKTTSIKPPSQENPRKKVQNESTSLKALTKARRLQRASSREALLQSHGSSSEDLPANVEAPVRRPRLIKKTKAAQLTITNGLELKKPVRKSREEKLESGSGGGSKGEERILESLPEIRHRTAISTIRSTADKCSRERDRSRTRTDEMKTRNYSKRECSNKGSVTNTSLLRQSTPAVIRNGGAQQHHHYQSHQRPSKDAGGVTQHRISTANIKKVHRSDAVTKH